MELQPDWKEFLSLLMHHGVRFVVIGGHALAANGRPRYTEGFDVFVEPTEANARRLVKTLVAFGFRATSRCSTKALLQLQAAVGARAVGQRRRGPARGARRLLGLRRRSRSAERLWIHALADQRVAPVILKERAELGKICLLDQEVCLGPSTLAGAGRAANQHGNPGFQTPIAQLLHVGDRPRHRRHHRRFVEQFLRFGGG